jgi:hypothetical protein
MNNLILLFGFHGIHFPVEESIFITDKQHLNDILRWNSLTYTIVFRSFQQKSIENIEKRKHHLSHVPSVD